MAKKKKERVVVILEAELKNDVVKQLKAGISDSDGELTMYINKYKEVLENQGVEVFETFSYFLVCEDCIYIALYEDEVEEIEEDLSQKVNKKG